MARLLKPTSCSILRAFRSTERTFLNNKSVGCSFHTGQIVKQQKVAEKSNETKDNPYPFMSALKDNQFHSGEAFIPQGNPHAWRHQGLVMSLSMSVFLIYFCYLREENELDEALATPLYSLVPGLEEKDLKVNIKYLKSKGEDTTHLEARLHDLQTGKA